MSSRGSSLYSWRLQDIKLCRLWPAYPRQQVRIPSLSLSPKASGWSPNLSVSQLLSCKIEKNVYLECTHKKAYVQSRHIIHLKKCQHSVAERISLVALQRHQYTLCIIWKMLFLYNVHQIKLHSFGSCYSNQSKVLKKCLIKMQRLYFLFCQHHIYLFIL